MPLILTRQKRDKNELVEAMEIMVLESAEWMELRENKKNVITGHSLMTPRMNYQCLVINLTEKYFSIQHTYIFSAIGGELWSSLNQL